jgi:hypothetical protein
MQHLHTPPRGFWLYFYTPACAGVFVIPAYSVYSFILYLNTPACTGVVHSSWILPAFSSIGRFNVCINYTCVSMLARCILNRGEDGLMYALIIPACPCWGGVSSTGESLPFSHPAGTLNICHCIGFGQFTLHVLLDGRTIDGYIII